MLEIIIRFLEAAALGAMIGIEREVVVSSHKKETYDTPQSVFGGLRSYTLMALLGAMSVYIGEVVGSPQSMIFFVGGTVFVFILASYFYSAFRHDQFGVTSEFAGLVTFLVGALAMAGEIQIAVFIGIMVTVMLAAKSHIAPLLDKIGKEEVTNTLKFAVIALIILPLLPDAKYSLRDMLVFLPDNNVTNASFLNPYSTWLFVVVMSAVSYVGYILTRMFGASKGIIVSGAIGGMVSSTAVTSAMAEKSHQHASYIRPAAIATITACTIMLVRVIGIVAFVNPYLLGTLLWPLMVMLITSGVIIWYLSQKNNTHTNVGGSRPRSPFEIIPALKFAGLIVGIKFFSNVAIQIFGESATWVVALFSGIADVDAITQDMAERSLSTTLVNITPLTATIAIIIALMTNTIVKIVLAKKFGHKKFGNSVAISLSTVLGLGAVTLGIVSLIG